MDLYQARHGLTRKDLKRAYYGLLYGAAPAMIRHMFNIHPGPIMRLTSERRDTLIREVANLIEEDEIVAAAIIARIVELRRDGHSNHNIQVILAQREGHFLHHTVDPWVLNMLQLTHEEYEFWLVGVILETIDWHLAWGVPEFNARLADVSGAITGKHFDRIIADDLETGQVNQAKVDGPLGLDPSRPPFRNPNGASSENYPGRVIPGVPSAPISPAPHTTMVRARLFEQLDQTDKALAHVIESNNKLSEISPENPIYHDLLHQATMAAIAYVTQAETLTEQLTSVQRTGVAGPMGVAGNGR